MSAAIGVGVGTSFLSADKVTIRRATVPDQPAPPVESTELNLSFWGGAMDVNLVYFDSDAMSGIILDYGRSS